MECPCALLDADNASVMGATYSGLISARAAHILYSVSKRLSRKHRMVGVAW